MRSLPSHAVCIRKLHARRARRKSAKGCNAQHTLRRGRLSVDEVLDNMTEQLYVGVQSESLLGAGPIGVLGGCNAERPEATASKGGHVDHSLWLLSSCAKSLNREDLMGKE